MKISNGLLKPFKKKKKTAPNQLFKGVAHEQPWSPIVCLLWGSSIVFSFFLAENVHESLLKMFMNPFIPVFGIAIVMYLAFFLNPQNANFQKV